MDLPEVPLSRVGPNSGAMLHGHPGVRIVVHPDTGDELDALLILLAELVHTATADRDDFPNVPLRLHPDILAEPVGGKPTGAERNLGRKDSQNVRRAAAHEDEEQGRHRGDGDGQQGGTWPLSATHRDNGQEARSRLHALHSPTP